MGAKAAYITLSLNGLSTLVWISIMFINDWFYKEFHGPGTGVLVPGGIMTTKAGLVTVNFEFPWCKAMEWVKTSRDRHIGDKLCSFQQAESSYLAGQDAFCDDQILFTTFPSGCMGMWSLRWAGIFMFFCVFLTIVLQIVSSVLIVYYFNVSPKKKYRLYALACLVFAPCADFLGLILYAVAIGQYCRLFSASRVPFLRTGGAAFGGGMNMSACWVIAAMNVIFMFVLPFVVNAMKTSNERLLQQARLQKEFDMEMARFSSDAYATDPYTGVQVDPYGAPVSGAQNGLLLNGGDPVSGAYNPYGASPYPYPGGGAVYA
jgi:hypothetical protein